MRIYNPYHKPSLDECIELFSDQFEIRKMPKHLDAETEAKKFYEKWAEKNWMHKGQKIVDWTKFAVNAVIFLRENNLPGAKPSHSTKVAIFLTDCCWSKVQNCECNIILNKNIDVESAFSFDDDDNAENSVLIADWLAKHCKQHEIFLDANHDENWFKSNQRGFAENYMIDNADEYFRRMGPWIEFISRDCRAYTELQHRMIEEYTKWLRANSLPLLSNDCANEFDLFKGEKSPPPTLRKGE